MMTHSQAAQLLDVTPLIDAIKAGAGPLFKLVGEAADNDAVKDTVAPSAFVIAGQQSGRDASNANNLIEVGAFEIGVMMIFRSYRDKGKGEGFAVQSAPAIGAVREALIGLKYGGLERGFVWKSGRLHSYGAGLMRWIEVFTVRLDFRKIT